MHRSLRTALAIGILICAGLGIWLLFGANPAAPGRPRPASGPASANANPSGPELLSGRERRVAARHPERDAEFARTSTKVSEGRRLLIRESDGRLASGLEYWLWSAPPTFAEAGFEPRAIDMPELPSSAGTLPAGGLLASVLVGATHLTVQGADDHLVTWSVDQLAGPVILPARAEIHCAADLRRGWRVMLLPLVHHGEVVAERHEGRALVELWQAGGVRASLLRRSVARADTTPPPVAVLQGRPFGVRASADRWVLEAPAEVVAPGRVDCRRQGRAPVVYVFTEIAEMVEGSTVVLLGADGRVESAPFGRRGAVFAEGIEIGMSYRITASDRHGQPLQAELTADQGHNLAQLRPVATQQPPVRLGLPLDAGEKPHTVVVYTAFGEFALEPKGKGVLGYRTEHTEVLVSAAWRDAEGFGAVWRDGRVARTRAYLHEPYLEWVDNRIRPGISLAAIYEHLGQPPEGVLVVLGTTRLEPAGTRWRRLQELSLANLAVRSAPLLLTAPERHLRLRFEGPDGESAELPLVGW